MKFLTKSNFFYSSHYFFSLYSSALSKTFYKIDLLIKRKENEKTLIAALIGLSALAQAHEVWVATPAQIASNSALKADLAYGDYPYVEKFPKTSCYFPQWNSSIKMAKCKP